MHMPMGYRRIKFLYFPKIGKGFGIDSNRSGHYVYSGRTCPDQNLCSKYRIA